MKVAGDFRLLWQLPAMGLMVLVVIGVAAFTSHNYAEGAGGDSTSQKTFSRKIGAASPKSHGSAPLEEGYHDVSDPNSNKVVRVTTTSATTTSAPAQPPLVQLFDVKVRANRVLYVTDFSESTQKYWSEIMRELGTSIGDLWLDQEFTVIVMSDRVPLQAPLKGALIQGSKANQGIAANWLLQRRSAAKTDPEAALKRAFKSIEKGPSQPTVIYFITDSAMMSTDLPDVVKTLNKDAKATMVTIQVGDASADTEKVLRTIAEQNDGKFNKVKLKTRE